MRGTGTGTGSALAHTTRARRAPEAALAGVGQAVLAEQGPGHQGQRAQHREGGALLPEPGRRLGAVVCGAGGGEGVWAKGPQERVMCTRRRSSVLQQGWLLRSARRPTGRGAQAAVRKSVATAHGGGSQQPASQQQAQAGPLVPVPVSMQTSRRRPSLYAHPLHPCWCRKAINVDVPTRRTRVDAYVEAQALGALGLDDGHPRAVDDERALAHRAALLLAEEAGRGGE